ncbi:ABC transporter permease [soil metagenome]|jgi:ribose transport system permease protein
MTSKAGAADGNRSPWLTAGAWRRLFRDQPLIPLLLLLVVLLVVLWWIRPSIINQSLFINTIRFAVPLAILAACQTLAMLTGGIDLSVASVASIAAVVMATQAPTQGPVVAIALALGLAAAIGLVNGIGIGIFRVHPLIMTLGMGLIVFGLAIVYQRMMVSAGATVPPEVVTLASGTTFGFIPNVLLLFVPLAALIILALRRSGFGRLLYAVGDNEVAARLSGVRVWSVLLTLYVISSLLAGVAGLLYGGAINFVSATLVDLYLLPSVAAAVIGGTSIFGGHGGYSGSIVGAVILTVMATLLNVMQVPEAIRQMLFGAIILVVAAAYTRITEET